MKRALDLLLKLGVTVAILVAIFLEFGGGWVAVDGRQLSAPGTFEAANPAFPGLVGRLRAKVTGAELPPPRLPVAASDVCTAATERSVFVRTTDGTMRRFKPTKHCRDTVLATVYVAGPNGTYAPVPATDPPAEIYFRAQGFQLVPAELSDVWAELRNLRFATFLPWFLAAMAVKLLGIFANVLRWQVLLRGQGIRLRFGFLSSTYFIGRYFGIVTPSTVGLDAWRLYETIRLTRRPVECTTVLAIERVIGLVGLFAVILMFMPFAGRVTQGQSFGELVGALKIPLGGTALFGVLILLRPTWFRGLLRVIPSAKLRGFVGNVIESATAYGDHRGALLVAVGLAVVGQLTTTLMYFCNAMAIATQHVHATEVLFASAIMTLGTFVAPSASGEGVRELVFVWLLGTKAGAAKAFLIGNLGFWIEKIPLSVPGGLILLMRQDPTLHAVTQADLDRLRRETALESGRS